MQACVVTVGRAYEAAAPSGRPCYDVTAGKPTRPSFAINCKNAFAGSFEDDRPH